MKENYPSYLILIRYGNFYNTYFDDAILLSCLCSYKIVNNKIGFPCTSLDNVKLYIKNRKTMIVNNEGILDIDFFFVAIYLVIC